MFKEKYMYKRVITLIVCIAFLAGCATLDFKKRNEECNELLDESVELLKESIVHSDSLQTIIDNLQIDMDKLNAEFDSCLIRLGDNNDNN